MILFSLMHCWPPNPKAGSGWSCDLVTKQTPQEESQQRIFISLSHWSGDMKDPQSEVAFLFYPVMQNQSSSC